MKKGLINIIFIFISTSLIGQSSLTDSIALSRNRITKTAMVTLGSWALANIVSALAIAPNTQGETKYMWRMNGYWNLINLGLAGLGYAGVHQTASKHLGFTDNYKAQHSIEKLYVFNAGLDLAYIAGGFYLRERGKYESDSDKANQLKGYGNSIVIQGGFLLFMDAVMITLHKKNTNRMNDSLQKLELEAAPGSIGIIYKF